MATKKNLSVFIRSLTAVIVLISLTACAGRNNEPVSDTRYLLGTFVTVRVYGRAGSDVFNRLFARVLDIERKMSVNEDNYDDTELLRVNRAAGQEPVEVSPDTYEVVRRALEYSELSEGAFDVSIGPLVQLWDIGGDNPRVPANSEIQTARDLVGFATVQMLPQNRIYLPRAGMALDVGGIAKGYAADESARILRESGIQNAILDFGGNVVALGNRPDSSPWRIGVQHPDQSRETHLGIVRVIDKTVVTSGPYERFFFHNGARYHHILDTATGFPAENGLISVTIVTQSSITADALSTAVYVLGLERGARLIRSLEHVEAVLVDDQRTVYVSPGLRDSFTLTDTAFRTAEFP